MPIERIEGLPPQEALPPKENGENLDPSKLFVTFAGQGSQVVGMGSDLYQNSQAARDVFHEADRTLRLPLSEMMFQGSKEALKRTELAQIAIITLEEAERRTIEAFSGIELQPKAYAGHSLGNFEAAVASGAASFPDILLLVQERGILMQKAAEKNPGTMAAITGLELQVLIGICHETGAEIGVINTDNQIVITGHKRAVAQAIDLAIASRARRATELQVNGAWHSSLMKEAQEEFQKAIFKTPFTDPRRPVISNHTGEPLTTAEGIQMDLVHGMCGTVLWNKLFKRGVKGASAAVEIGPKSVLSSFAKQIQRDIQTFTVESFESAQKLAQLLQQPANLNNRLTA